MSNKLETISDIIAEMRIGVNALQKYGAKPRKRDGWMVFLAMFADSIEAAYKREMGNVQKMREALEQVVELAKAWASPGADAAVTLGLIIDRAQDSLSAPPRNCDVGTEVELPFEVKGYYIVKTGTNYAVAKSNLAGIERQCAEMNTAVLEWHKQKLAHECASAEQEEKQ